MVSIRLFSASPTARSCTPRKLQLVHNLVEILTAQSDKGGIIFCFFKFYNEDR